jgi:hypothetical protein
MTTIKLTLCAALVAVTCAAPAGAGHRRVKAIKSQPFKSQQFKLQHLPVPLFLGVGY